MSPEDEHCTTPSQICVLAFTSRSSEHGQNVHIYLAQKGGRPTDNFRELRIDKLACYDAFCDDFGPMNMLSIIRFNELLDDHIQECRQCGLSRMVCTAGNGVRALTNAAFLLGSYMLFSLDLEPEQIHQRFGGVSKEMFEGYRDATFSQADFRLSLLDCWRGLNRGKAMGWVARPASDGDPFWGQIDKDSYEHYDNPKNADLHEVVPDKFVAFRGPRDLGGRKYHNNHALQCREFAAEYYVDIFNDLGVTNVVRLNEIAYSERVFADSGIEHADLYFEDCTPPPHFIVQRFFEVVDGAQGMVAVHCKAGLGRTGTLIALYLMFRHRFTAREAVGWLRIMRSGSIIGSQQQYLCEVEKCLRSSPSHGVSCCCCSSSGGVARALDYPDSDITVTAAHLVSPRRASPEQRHLSVGCGVCGHMLSDDGILAEWPTISPSGDGEHDESAESAAKLAAQVSAAMARRSGAIIRRGTEMDITVDHGRLIHLSRISNE